MSAALDESQIQNQTFRGPMRAFFSPSAASPLRHQPAVSLPSLKIARPRPMARVRFAACSPDPVGHAASARALALVRPLAGRSRDYGDETNQVDDQQSVEYTMSKANKNSKSKGINSKAPAQKSSSSMSKKDIRQEVTDRIINIMERGPQVWRKTWTTAAAQGLPVNGSSGASYRGINVLTLWCEAQERGFSSSRWMTYKQAQAAGAQVRKGEKGTSIVFYQMLERDELQEDGSTEERRFPMLKSFTVFNADQIDGLPTSEQPGRAHEPIPAADAVIAASGASIKHGGSRAAYSPTRDVIVMPKPEAFESAAGYYGTTLHELAHWTGHPSRLNRDLSGRFGDDDYAMEELIAELASAFCAGSLGFIDATVEGHASYLDSWLKVLKSDKTAVFTAAAQAQAAHDFLVGDLLV